MVSSVTIHGIFGIGPSSGILSGAEGIGQSREAVDGGCVEDAVGYHKASVGGSTAGSRRHKRGDTGCIEQFLEKTPIGIVFKTIVNILGNRGEYTIHDKHGGIGRRDVERSDLGFFVDEVIAILIESHREAVTGSGGIGQHIVGEIDLTVLVTGYGVVFHQILAVSGVNILHRTITVGGKVFVYSLVVGHEQRVVSHIEVDGTEHIGVVEKGHPLGISVLLQPGGGRDFLGNREGRIFEIVATRREHRRHSYAQI